MDDGDSIWWRSPDELAQDDEFLSRLADEFPRQAMPLFDEGAAGLEGAEAAGVDRRRFLQLMGASLALSGAVGCTRQPLEKIVPYVEQPEEMVPGNPLYFATATTLSGYATGVVVESHEGRPTKIEGNAEHPASLGGTDARTQAAVLDLYDPDRMQAFERLGRIRTWQAFVDAMATALADHETEGGEGLRILTGTVTSPTVGRQLERILERFPNARWYQYEPAGLHAQRQATTDAFGEPLGVRYDVAAADVVVTLDADLLNEGPAAVRHAKQFGRRRLLLEGESDGAAAAAAMGRLYAIESTPTPTGSVADNRLASSIDDIERFAVALAAELGVPGAQGVPESSVAAGVSAGRRSNGRHGGRPLQGLVSSRSQERFDLWVTEVARDLRQHRGRSLVVAGGSVHPDVHVLAHAINERLGNVGATVLFTDSPEVEPTDQIDDIATLAAELEERRVDTLLILGANPVYDAPADLDFATRLEESDCRLRVHWGMRTNETSPYCHWNIPATHAFEAWGDARAFDGTVTIQQPLIRPLHEGRSIHEMLAILEDRPGVTGHDMVRRFWLEERGLDERSWRRALHDGLVPDTESPVREVTVDPAAVADAAAAVGERRTRGTDEAELTIAFRPDPSIYDGRFANNAWLQELPKPFSKLTWGNALIVSPAVAEEHGLESGDVVEIDGDGREIETPVWIQPGQADGTAVLHLGYGRATTGSVADGVGANGYRLRTRDGFWTLAGVAIEPTGRRVELASTQRHFQMENRDLVRQATLDEFTQHPEFAHDGHHAPDEEESLYPGFEYDGYAWGMGINLSACTGCNACVVACQSENNIPVVGEDQVIKQREMQWIRVDQYYRGDDVDAPHGVANQPVPCMHCEQAPCEVVCPVEATQHSDEGLNDMIYNRCVGTRYCSNNCPYKVRRFNFFKYADWQTESLKLQRNPDVTVRSRGVMEKCTYCVQRINRAKITAQREEREVRDGEIVTACQQACPTEAIVFGDINDPDSEVSRWKSQPLDYGLLVDLNTRPRTTYLAQVTNPNPRLVPAEATEPTGVGPRELPPEDSPGTDPEPAVEMSAEEET